MGGGLDIQLPAAKPRLDREIGEEMSRGVVGRVPAFHTDDLGLIPSLLYSPSNKLGVISECSARNKS